jgi:hypothetical protein
MEWIAASLLAIFLLWRFPRVTLKVLGVLFALALFVGMAWSIYLFIENKARDFEKSKISIVVELDDKCSPTWPLYVRIHNENSFSLDSVSFTISAKIPGRSSDVYHEYETSDLITPPGKTASTCYGVPSYKLIDGKIQGWLPKDLRWSAAITYFTKSP